MLKLDIHTGVTKKRKFKTVIAVVRENKETFYLWLPFNTGLYKDIYIKR